MGKLMKRGEFSRGRRPYFDLPISISDLRASFSEEKMSELEGDTSENEDFFRL